MLLQGRGKNDEMGCVRAILLWWTWRRDGGLFVRLVVYTKRTRSKFVVRPVLTSLRCWHSPSQLASSTNTRQVQNVYEGQSHVPVQPLASSTSQNVVRFHHSDRDRVIIVNKVIIRFIAQHVMSFFFHPRPLVPTFGHHTLTYIPTLGPSR